MKFKCSPQLIQAARLVKDGQLLNATTTLRRLLAGEAPAGGCPSEVDSEPSTVGGPTNTTPPGTQVRLPFTLSANFGSGKTGLPKSKKGSSEGGKQAPMPGVKSGVFGPGGLNEWSMPGQRSGPSPLAKAIPLPAGALFLSRTYSNEAGSRPYKVYVPSGYYGQVMPLIVMLHGCTQTPDDFAAGTRMNEAAEQHSCLVVYPEQTTSANMQKCWKWFSPSDQQRGGGEPSLIAGITREVMRDYAVDPTRVFIAGLSAGGAAAAIMGETYPDLYAAIGVHSGLARGSASDMPSAFAAMKGGDGAPARRTNSRDGTAERLVPAIVFHGDKDTTVNDSNADAVVAQSMLGATLAKSTEKGRAAGGLAYSRTLYRRADGKTAIEQWSIHGAGHAWSGGSPAGSYTLPEGPDATGEMVRFFLEHPHGSS